MHWETFHMNIVFALNEAIAQAGLCEQILFQDCKNQIKERVPIRTIT